MRCRRRRWTCDGNCLHMGSRTRNPTFSLRQKPGEWYTIGTAHSFAGFEELSAEGPGRAAPEALGTAVNGLWAVNSFQYWLSLFNTMNEKTFSIQKVKGTVKEWVFALDRFRTRNNSEGGITQAASTWRGGKLLLGGVQGQDAELLHRAPRMTDSFM